MEWLMAALSGRYVPCLDDFLMYKVKPEKNSEYEKSGVLLTEMTT
jgi:hypothetical protein